MALLRHLLSGPFRTDEVADETGMETVEVVLLLAVVVVVGSVAWRLFGSRLTAVIDRTGNTITRNTR